jgi:hypothetical protein
VVEGMLIDLIVGFEKKLKNVLDVCDSALTIRRES